MLKFLIRTVYIIVLLCTSGLAHAQTSPVRVQVYGTHEGGNIVYHYKVINNSNIAIYNFVIGNIYNSQYKFETEQLDREPLGWSYGPDGESGVEVLLSPTSTTQPPYWSAKMYGAGPGALNLEWSIIPDGGQPYRIQPGQSLAGFSVIVPLYDDRQGIPEYYNAGQIVDPTKPEVDNDDDKYLRSSFKTTYLDEQTHTIQTIRGQLEIADKTPPTLSVTLNPATIWPPNGKMVTINATVNAKDDYDPNPVIQLVSITANESLGKDDVNVNGGKLTDIFTDTRQFQLKATRAGDNLAGRIYTVTYIALDASGNQTMVSTTVTVPHDQGKK